MDMLPPIAFYIPASKLPSDAPLETMDLTWKGFEKGIYAWGLQTYLHLKAAGFPCKLTCQIPETGLVLAHRDILPSNFQPGAKRLIVCLKAERDYHPYAQLHVVQNPQEMQHPQAKFWGSYPIPLWTQPGLIPRRLERGDRFETAAYFGRDLNLAPELVNPTWAEQLQELGLSWRVVSRDRWHDYSEVDVAIAIRNFTGVDPVTKPASKLYNAWHAGVPAVMGVESSLRAERKTALDYLEVTSLEEAIAALKRLQDDPALRTAMVENGRIRAKETATEQMVMRWQALILQVAVPAYERWCAQPIWAQQAFLLRRYVVFRKARIKQRLKIAPYTLNG